MVSSPDVSKITPPSLSHVLERPRLMDYLTRSQEKKLILILGQAAQGKTTLASSYAAESTKPCVWLSLTEEESEAVNLFYVLVHALDHAFKKTDVSNLLSYPSLITGPRNPKALYGEWARAIFDALPEPANIFLDGLDSLLGNAPSLDLVQALIDNAPEGVQLILVSRQMPSLEIVGLRIRGQASILTNDYLGFSLEEMRAFLKGKGIHLSTQALQKIYLTTEGWVGGLVLLSDNLMQIPEDERDGHIEAEFPDQVKQEIFSWFGEEILGRQPPSLQNFLARSSILPVVDPTLAGELLDVPNPAELLHEMASKNLFVHSTYTEGGGWLFRYHQLFREFLQAKLESELPQDEKQKLWVSAADLYASKDRYQDALRYYLLAGAYGQAADVLEKMGMGLWKEGRVGDLARSLDQMPEEIVSKRPWLILYRCLIRRFTAPKENVADLQRALDMFVQEGDPGGHLLALAYLIEAAIVLGNDVVPLKDLVEKSRDLLSALSTDRYVYERAVLHTQTGFALVLRSRRTREGLMACESAWLLAKQEGDIPLQISSLTNMLNALSFLGEFQKAEEICEGLRLLLEQYSLPDLQAVCLINESLLRVLKGELKRADALISRAARIVETSGLTYLYPVTLLYELTLHPLLGRFSEAEETMGRLVSLARSLENLFLQGAAEMFGCVSAYHQGEFKRAGERIERARQILDSDKARSTFHLDWLHVLDALVAYHTGREFEIDNLKEGLQRAMQNGNHQYLVAAQLAIALSREKSGRKDQIVEHLSEGCRLVTERDLHFIWPLRPEDILKSCTLALELKIDGVLDAAERMLTGPLAPLAADAVKRLMDHADEQVRSRGREIYRRIHRSEVPLLRVQTLGRFQVHRGGEPIPEDQWTGGQSKTLLKAIVAQGSKRIPRDELIEVLYAGEGSANLKRNFKVALHRLRKSLEPEMDKTLGSSYIHLEDNLVYLDPELCETDVNRFFQLADQAMEAEEAGDLKTAEASYNQAIDLFSGHFLEGESHPRWADEVHRRLGETCNLILMRLGKIYEARGAIKKAVSTYEKAVESDPVHEEAYRRLMNLYMDTGRRNEALRVFNNCKLALAENLDTEPDEVTYAIYRKIKER